MQNCGLSGGTGYQTWGRSGAVVKIGILTMPDGRDFMLEGMGAFAHEVICEMLGVVYDGFGGAV